MNRKLLHMTLVFLGALALLGATVALANGPDPGHPRAASRDGLSGRLVAAQWPLTPTRFLTVTSTSDEIGSIGERCEQVVTCTLRRAINEARYYQADQETYLIAFDIPESDPGYDEAQEAWVIDLESGKSDITFIFRDFGTHGHVIIDGTTQPIGRDLSVGPRIVLRGDNDQGVFTLTGGDNVIRGLAFQGFGDWMISVPGTSQNLIEDNWFGLTLTGTAIYLRDLAHPEDGSGETGIYVQSGGVSNTVQSNVLAGFKEGAINLDSDYSFVLSNTVGTLANSAIPGVRPERKCRPNARYHNWFGGAGVDVGGTGNLIAYNRIVGMLWMSNDPINTPDDALEVTGHDHVIRENIIGVDNDGQPFGVCGEGIHLGGISGAHNVQVISNTVVGSQGEAAILTTGDELGYNLDAVTLRGNIIEDSAAEAVDFGKLVPSELRLFKSAAVTAISSDTVTGTHGLGSPCEDCVIELFLDRVDTVSETLESLAVVVADGDGNWTAPLPRPLLITEGIRTASTTVADGQIPHPNEPANQYSAGMTAKVSELYVQAGAPEPLPPTPPALEPPLDIPPITYMPPPAPPSSFDITITVESAADPDDSKDYTCYTDFDGPPEPAPDGVCTLRRAIIEATEAIEADPNVRPVLIQFDIPTDDLGYDGSAGVWIIQITDTLDLNGLPTLGSTNITKSGQVVISGTSQPDYEGLRPDDPRIVIRSPQANPPEGNALVVNGEGNVIQGLAFQGFRMNLQINHGGSIIRDNWFGLTVDGQEIYLHDVEAPEDGSGQSGIKIAENTAHHLVQDNRLAGFNGAAIDVEGDDSYILGNYVGTRADGTLPEVALNRQCKPNARYHNWFGGGGIEVGGVRNQVGGPNPGDRNVIAGLLTYSADPDNTPDTALELSGQDHLVQDNYVGMDVNGQKEESCGRGIEVGSGFTRILSNTLYGVGMEAFRSSGSQVDSNARHFQGNVVEDSAMLLEYGNEIPEALSIFTPTQVITIDGLDVSGGNGHVKAPCPYCQIELYLDDLDESAETLEPLAITLADADGDWSTTLPRTLALDEGLRTASTTRNYGVIQYYEAGTTSRFSQVYSQTGAVAPTPPPPPDPVTPPEIPEPVYLAPPEPPAAYGTVITVTTTADASSSNTCADVAPEDCSLRLAINQTEDITPAGRPVLIAFDIPISDDGYDPAGFWKITLSAAALPPVKGGQVTIDGSTQPGGRTGAPKIILWRNSSSGADLQLGETQFEGEHVVRDLAFQGVEVSMTGDGNIIQDNWLGLSDDGSAIYFYNDSPYNENHAIIIAHSSSDHNLIQDNRLAGSRTKAIDLKGGNDNVVRGNVIGALADGTVDVASVDPANICVQTAEEDNWFGGGGISSAVGKGNQIVSNTLVGLLIRGSASTTPPDAIELPSGQDNLVQYNRIGQDATGADVWICGSGMDIGSAYNRVLSNTIVGSYKEGLFVNGNVIAINANTLQGNVISDCVSAIEFGDAVPDALALFSPALATVISGTSVTGISVDACPYCRVDVYLDDDDDDTEALAHLGWTTTDINGNWDLELDAPLAEDEGLRTISTARDYGVVAKFEAGTSSRLSMLFTEQPPTPPSAVVIAGPETGTVGQPYSFVASVSPLTATLPITYVWQATGQDEQTVLGSVEEDVSFTWNSAGEKTVVVTVSNGWGSSVEDTFTIAISEEAEDYYIYLPLVLRASN